MSRCYYYYYTCTASYGVTFFLLATRTYTHAYTCCTHAHKCLECEHDDRRTCAQSRSMCATNYTIYMQHSSLLLCSSAAASIIIHTYIHTIKHLSTSYLFSTTYYYQQSVSSCVSPQTSPAARRSPAPATILAQSSRETKTPNPPP